LETLIQERDNEVGQHEKERRTLRTKLQEANAQISSSNAITDGLRTKLETAETKQTLTEQRLSTSVTDLTAAQAKLMQLTSQPGAPFYDPNTNTTIVCPVLQSNGHIVPLKSVITKWFATAGPDDGYIFRTYICPIMQHPTTLASLATQDRIRHIAKHTGINTDSPLIFSYMSDGEWNEFPFHDQLNIIAKICTIQTMQINDCVDHIIVHHNTMAFEINAAFTQVASFV
jgi:hypothetical protein